MKYFLVAAGLSFVGSIPIGLITLTIVQKTLKKGWKSGIMIALGASVMEFIYTLTAVTFTSYFSENFETLGYIQLVIAILFLVIGTYYVSKKGTVAIAHSKNYSPRDFFKGFYIGLLNMLLLPYWVLLSIWLTSLGYSFEDLPLNILFTTGATLGAFIVFLLYIMIARLMSKKIDLFINYGNKIIGIIFVLLGIIQLYQWFVIN